MSPRDQQRLLKIQEYCNVIQATVSRYGDSFEVFQTDRDYQNSVSFSILQIGELVVGFTQEYRTATKEQIPWPQIRGMRNIIVHNYGSVNLKVVWDIVTVDILELERFCKEQLANSHEE